MSQHHAHSSWASGSWVLSISLVVLELASGRAAEAQTAPAKPPLIVQYHMWWDTSYGVQSTVWPTTSRSNQRAGDLVWAYWDLREYGVPGARTPESIETNGWGRISTNTRDYYPLIGLYDPDDPEVLRWHIRTAKAAGVDAFALSLYNWWFNPLAERRLHEIFRKALDVAQEENFKIAWEAWWGGQDLPAYFNRYKDVLAHPAFYKVRYGGADLPLIWIAPGRPPANFFGDSVAQFDGIIDAIERNVGPCVWAINNGTGFDYTTSRARKILMGSGNLFWASDAAWATDTKNFVAAMKARGIRAATHVYPGFDELDIRPLDKRHHSRRGGETLARALAASADAKADFTFLESWNDFGESTAIEPGFKEDTYEGAYAGDLYKDLRIVAAHKGVSFSPPALPPDSSIDPLMLKYVGGKTRFVATVGLGAGADSGNGVIYNLFGLYSGKWVALASRHLRPADGTVSIAADLAPFFGKGRVVILGAGAHGDPGWDWAHWASASLEFSGNTSADLVASAPAANWHSPSGAIPWGTGGAGGTAMYAYDQTLMGGRRFARTLYTHPSLAGNGFSHGGYVVDVVPGANRRRVTFRATAALGNGATCSTGVVFGLYGWNGTSWVSLASRVVRPADGATTFTADLSSWHGAVRSFVLGADAYGDPSCDWAHFGEAKIQVDGRTVYDFVASAPSAGWHSTTGGFAWGAASPNGSAYHVYNAAMMGGRIFAKALYLHPNLVVNGFSHGGYSVDLR